MGRRIDIEAVDRCPGRGVGAAATVPDFDFQQVLEQADVGICITQDGLFQYVNPKFAQMHGCHPLDLFGTEFMQVVHPEERAKVAEIRRLRDAGRHDTPYESRNLRRDGSVFDTRIFGRAIEYRGRQANLVTMSDVSDLAAAHRLAAWQARMLLSNELLCRSGSIEVDLPRRRVRLSGGAQAVIAGSSPNGELGLAAALRCIPAGDRALLMSQWRQARPGRPFEFCHRLQKPDGSLLRVLHRGVLEIGEQDARLRPVATLQDITQQAEAQAQVDQLLNYHPVTGLATRPRLLACARSALELARRDQQPLAMLYLSVPDLDRVHRALGLAAGDALATTLADQLVRHCREADTVAHLGGGDFAILLDPASGADEAQALHVATRLIAAIEAPATVGATELICGGRIGVALFPADADGEADLLDHAHTACVNGEGSIRFFTREAARKASRRIHLESGLRHAFERRELALHYQPQVDLRDGRIAGVEALLRWQSQEFGAVSPAEFVPIAEEIGLIVAIGEWVFRSACEQSVAWARDGLPAVRIGVNLSPRQLEQPDIARRLRAVLTETGADPSSIGVEVTESVLMHDLEHARRTLDELSAIGIEISLDDFGTGYSNLGVLRALPFDVLKIDRSLVHDVTAAPEDVSITRAVLMLARGLKIKVLAEGVETEGQLELLVSNGCDMMQGYVFSKPLPPDAVAGMLREARMLPERFRLRTAGKRGLPPADGEKNIRSPQGVPDNMPEHEPTMKSANPRIARGPLRPRTAAPRRPTAASSVRRRPRAIAAVPAAEPPREPADALTLALAQAASAAKAKRTFLANVSHEVRTPLNAIIGLTHLLRREAADPIAADRLDQISDSARHLMAVMSDVLDLSKIESGEFELELHDFSLDTLLSRACAQVAGEAQRKGLELVIDAAHVPRSLRGDVSRLSQALVHLLGNAVKFTERGSVTLSVTASDSRPGGWAAADGMTTVRFEVRDTGIGIDGEAAERLYAAFEQVDDSATRQHGGTGLGLILTRRLASVMGGEAGVTSALGAGSTFWFSARLQTVAGGEGPAADEPLKGRSVLVVDDRPEARLAIAEMLRHLGMATDTAASGEEALHLADEAERRGAPYDVILLDRIMPGMDGLDTAQALIAQAGPVMPAFIMVSGSVEVDFVAKARELDIGSVLQKPLSFGALHGHLLRVLLDRSDGNASPYESAPRPRDNLRARFRPARVLLAEDHPVNQRVASTLLKLAGLEVDVAANGVEAVALSARHAYDLVLMDVQMPEMDGLEATRRIRAQPGREALPIVAMTANVFLDDRAACNAAGMDAHLAKPVDPPLLYDTLSRWLSMPGVPAPRAAAVPAERADEPPALGPLARVEGLATERGLRFFGNDPDTYRSALVQFASMYANGLRAGADTGTAPELQRRVHSLAGASAAVGAVDLQARAEAAEARLREAPRTPPPELFDALDREVRSFSRRVLAALDELPM